VKTRMPLLKHVSLGFLAAFLALPVAACAVETAPGGQSEATVARTVPGSASSGNEDSTTTTTIGSKGPRRKSRSMDQSAEPNPSPWTEGEGSEPNPSPWNGGSGGGAGGGSQDPKNHSHDATLSKDALNP
jgi:hypothetical protein